MSDHTPLQRLACLAHLALCVASIPVIVVWRTAEQAHSEIKSCFVARLSHVRVGGCGQHTGVAS